MSDKKFVQGNDYLDAVLADPDLAAEVALVTARTEERDRTYAMTLAMLREASALTQTQLATKLGVGQAAVSRTERRGDMLLSTLNDYLAAIGAQRARVVVTVNGQDVELELSGINLKQ
jgi:DNA-binding transcriptional regulator YiaG